MSVPITRSAHPDLLWPGVKSIFGSSYNEYPPEWSQIFTRETSTKAYEKIVETTGFGLAPVKSEGAPIQYDADGQGYTSVFTHVVYALGFIVTKEAIDDGQYSEVAERRARKLARSMRTTAEIVHANVLNRAFSTDRPIGDGKPLIASDHPTRSGTQSNLLTASDLSEAALEDAITSIEAAKDSRGLPIASRVTKLIIHPSNRFNVERILGSDLRSNSESNDVNALKRLGSVPQVVVNHYLTDPDAFFLMTDVDDGFMSFWRREADLTRDNDFDTENARAKSAMRFAAGVADWRAVYGSPGA